MIKGVGIWRRTAMELTGVTVFASGVHIFVAYNHIVPGGITGIASMGNYLFDIPIGMISFLLNFPILSAGFYFLGRQMILRTLVTVVELSFMLDVGVAWLPVYQGNLLLASICGGLCMGSGLSVILLSGTTTGGGDLLGRLIQKKEASTVYGKNFTGHGQRHNHSFNSSVWRNKICLLWNTYYGGIGNSIGPDLQYPDKVKFKILF